MEMDKNKKQIPDEVKRESEIRIFIGGLISLIGVTMSLVVTIIFQAENQLSMLLHHPILGVLIPLAIVLIGWWFMYSGLKLVKEDE